MLNDATPINCRDAWRPHAITDRRFWDRARDAAHFASWRDAVGTAARDASPRPALPAASDFLAARRYNDRSRVDRAWQSERTVLSALAAQRCLDGFAAANTPTYGEFEGRDDRLLDWLWDVLNQPTWSVVAHLHGQELPDLSAPHTLDLASCEFALALAELREVLGPWMDAVSANLSGSVLHEIDRRIIEPFARSTATQPAFWSDPETVNNNWTGVCAGSIVAACESLCAQGYFPDHVAAARERALKLLDVFLVRAFTPGGECEEGMGYWSYGLGYACLGWMRLSRKEFIARVDLDRLKRVAEHPRRVHLFSDTFYGRGDANWVLRPPLGWMWWLAEAVESDWLGAWCRRSGTIAARRALLPWRELIVLDALADQAAEAAHMAPELPSGPGCVRYLVDLEAGVFRAGAEGELVATLAGGTNHQSHNHNDLGHVNVWHKERSVLLDLCAPNYTTDFFGPRRYQYLAASSRGHNVPVINGCEQRDGSEAEARVLSQSDESMLLDLTSAYPPETGLTRWTRRLAAGDEILVTDSFEFENAGRVVLRYWSVEEPELLPDDDVRFGDILVSFDPAPARTGIETESGDQHQLKEFAGRQLYCCCANFAATPGTELQVTTRIRSCVVPAI